MSNIKDFIGGGFDVYNPDPILTSQIFTVPFNGWFTVACSGGGGSGGSTSSSNQNTSGGNSGCLNVETLYLTKDEAITVTIGAGAPGVTSYSDGNKGGATSFGDASDTNGVYLIADGGTGGEHSGNSISIYPKGVGFEVAANVYTQNPTTEGNQSNPNPIIIGNRTLYSKSHGGQRYSGDSVYGGGAPSLLGNGGDALSTMDGGIGAGGGGKHNGTSGAGGDGFVVISGRKA